MPTPTERPSIDTNLENRYKKQRCGGAFDAKGGTPDVFGLQEKMWTKAGFVGAGDEGLGIKGRKKWNQSQYNQGHTVKKYTNTSGI